MSGKIPVVTGGRLVRALTRAGFRVSTIVGSHHVMRHPDGRRTSVPVHGSANVKRGTVAGILAAARMDADDLRRLL